MQKGRAKASQLAEVMRRLYTACERWNIRLEIRWVSTKVMGAADDISRGVRAKPPVRCLHPDLFAALEAQQGGFSGGAGPELGNSVAPGGCGAAGAAAVAPV